METDRSNLVAIAVIKAGHDKLVSSSALVRKELGWSPHRSELKQMITDSWRWHQIGLYLQ